MRGKQSLSLDAGNFTQASVLIALCFEARTATHYAHLRTTSYAEHKALDEFYSQIIGLVDTYAESYQGRFGVIVDYPRVELKAKDGRSIIETVRMWIDNNRAACGEYSELQNVIDEIVSLCNSTLYKLDNLK